jgi:hypothetical protein
MRPASLFPAALLVVAALGAAACDERLADVAGPSPNLSPTFSSISKEIFESADSSGRVACTNCHTNVGRTPAGGLNLLPGIAYGALVSVNSAQKPALKRVEPGNPDASYLVHKLEGAPDIVGLRMPRTGPPYLTSGQMIIIRRWIELGAKND